jgi:hypothetical protein
MLTQVIKKRRSKGGGVIWNEVRILLKNYLTNLYKNRCVRLEFSTSISGIRKGKEN